MKKYLVLLVSIIISILSVSCNKEKEQDEAFSLVGTTWVGATSSDHFYVFRFLSETDVEYTRRKNRPDGEIYMGPYLGTYELSYPTLNIVLKNGVSTIPWECVFVDEKTYRSYDSYHHLIEFHKQ